MKSLIFFCALSIAACAAAWNSLGNVNSSISDVSTSSVEVGRVKELIKLNRLNEPIYDERLSTQKASIHKLKTRVATSQIYVVCVGLVSLVVLVVALRSTNLKRDRSGS